jgi:hypothetical protein
LFPTGTRESPSGGVEKCIGVLQVINLLVMVATEGNLWTKTQTEPRILKRWFF